MNDIESLASWLEENSSGAYRKCDEAAYLLRELNKKVESSKTMISELINSDDFKYSFDSEIEYILMKTHLLKIAANLSKGN